MLLFKCLVVSLLVLSDSGSAKPTKKPRIIIVGAGLAGVAAAVKLIEGGLDDLIILEAENRVGGRIYSIPFAGGLVDMGAQWVHGETNNVVYDTVNNHFGWGDTGFEKADLDFETSDGIRPDQERCLRLFELSEKILTSFTEQMRFRGSLGDFFNGRFKKALKSDKYNDVSPELSEMMIDYMEKEVNNWNGSSTWFDVSSRGNAMSGVNDGNQYQTWRDKGYITFFDYLTKKLPDPSKEVDVKSKVKLNTKVINIKRDPKSKNKKVEVLCEDGSKYEADHVIFTGSLGVLKSNHKTLFTPKLPKKKVLAIETLGYGTLGKIFLEYDQPFWSTDPNDFVGFSFLWTQSDIKSLKGTDREWLISLQNFFRVDRFPHVIEGLVAGKNLAEFELLDDMKVLNDSVWMLEKFLAKPLPRPIRIVKTKWLTSRNFLGTYSYRSVSADRNGIIPSHIGQSILSASAKPTVLFAGEATDDAFSSNAHGAVNSGWRVAKELIEYNS